MQKWEIFCCDEAKSEQVFGFYEPFFALMKQKRGLFCSNEAKVGF
jgi:hypothetical protein